MEIGKRYQSGLIFFLENQSLNISRHATAFPFPFLPSSPVTPTSERLLAPASPGRK